MRAFQAQEDIQGVRGCRHMLAWKAEEAMQGVQGERAGLRPLLSWKASEPLQGLRGRRRMHAWKAEEAMPRLQASQSIVLAKSASQKTLQPHRTSGARAPRRINVVEQFGVASTPADLGPLLNGVSDAVTEQCVADFMRTTDLSNYHACTFPQAHVSCPVLSGSVQCEKNPIGVRCGGTFLNNT